MVEHYITWWNVENLFDTQRSRRRPRWLARALSNELESWSSRILRIKLRNLSSVMQKMNDGNGSDIYGLCEAENLHVLQRLANNLNRGLPERDYKVILHNSDDKRGMDLGVIYDAKKYRVRQSGGENKVFTYRITKRSPTRDILQVELITRNNHDLVLLLNHWYSRLSGKFESEPYRIISAETLSYWIMRIQEELGDHIPILVMGDFNDEPFDRSLVEYALSSNNRSKVSSSRNPYLYNLMWEIASDGLGTYVHDYRPYILDQFLVSKGLLDEDGDIQLNSGPVTIEIFEGMATGKYQTPVRFKKSGNDYNLEGFSDHLPISVKLLEKD